MLKKPVLAILAAFAVMGPVAAQITRQGDGFLFRAKWTKGQTMRYNMATSMGGAQGSKSTPTAMNMPMVYRVADVKGGVATVEMTIGPMSGMKGAEPEKVSVRIDQRGRIVGGDERIRQMSMSSSIEFPERPIRLGHTWTTDQRVQGMSVRSTYRFAEMKTIGGRQVAVLTFQMSGDGQGGMKISGDGTIMLRAEDGSMHSMSSNPTMQMAGSGKGQPMTIKTSVSITRA
jgi:hypothetical protein